MEEETPKDEVLDEIDKAVVDGEPVLEDEVSLTPSVTSISDSPPAEEPAMIEPTAMKVTSDDENLDNELPEDIEEAPKDPV